MFRFTMRHISAAATVPPLTPPPDTPLRQHSMYAARVRMTVAALACASGQQGEPRTVDTKKQAATALA